MSRGLHLFDIYYEEADGDEPRRLLGQMRADTMGDVLDLAAQYYEKPSHDLVAIQVVDESTLWRGSREV